LFGREIITAADSHAQEDDWLALKSARSMLTDWQKTYQDPPLCFVQIGSDNDWRG
jgi:hypothetical protein